MRKYYNYLIFKILFSVLEIVYCLDKVSLDMTVEYFLRRNVNDMCVLYCGDWTWPLKFMRKTSKYSMKSEFIDIDTNYLEDKVHNCLNKKVGLLGVVLDAGCQNCNDVLTLGSLNSFFDATHFWFVIRDINNKTEPKNLTEPSFMPADIFDTLNLSVNADIVMALREDEVKYSLFDVFNFGKVQNGKLNVTILGQWTSSQGLKIWQTGCKHERRWDFHGLTLRLIITSTIPSVFKPEMLMSVTDSPGINIILKTSYMILDTVSKSHNFKYNYTVTDLWIGTYTRNSSRAVSTSLYFREQDISPVLRLNLEIFNVVDAISTSITSIETRYYYQIPSSGIGKFENRFLTPLTPQVWLLFLAMLALCASVLVLAAYLERRPLPAQYALFTVLASASQQYFVDFGEGLSKRVSIARQAAVFITGLSCLLIYNYYTSSVVSWLLNGPPPSINSLRELLDSPLELILEDVAYTKSWLEVPGYCFNYKNRKIENELRKRKILSKKKGDPLQLSLNDGIDMVKAGGYAFHAQVAHANKRISKIFDKNELCELGTLESMPRTDLYAILQKQSPYKEFFDWSVLRLKERGIISAIQRRTASPDISCDGSMPRALALGGAAPAFIMLAMGFIVSIVILVFEIIFNKRIMQNTWSTRSKQNIFFQ